MREVRGGVEARARWVPKMMTWTGNVNISLSVRQTSFIHSSSQMLNFHLQCRIYSVNVHLPTKSNYVKEQAKFHQNKMQFFGKQFKSRIFPDRGGIGKFSNSTKIFHVFFYRHSIHSVRRALVWLQYAQERTPRPGPTVKGI